MKKVLVVLAMIGIAAKLFAFGMCYIAANVQPATQTITDEEFMNMYIEKNYGEGYTGKIVPSSRENEITFEITDSEGNVQYCQLAGKEQFKEKYANK